MNGKFLAFLSGYVKATNKDIRRRDFEMNFKQLPRKKLSKTERRAKQTAERKAKAAKKASEEATKKAEDELKRNEKNALGIR